MRLQAPLYVRGPVASIRLRVRARDVPEDHEITLTDLQLQPGQDTSGVTVSPLEAGSRRGRRQYRNGTIHDGLEIVALANIDRVSPARLEVLNAEGDTRVSSYRFGNPAGQRAYVDPRRGTASHGWGRPPLITRRSDLTLRPYLGSRAHIRLEWEDREE